MSGQVLAHGIGGRQDLPVPFEHALAGAVVALVATVMVLALAWRRSRFRGDTTGRPLPTPLAGFLDARATRLALRVAGVLAAGWAVVELLAGPPSGPDNPVPGVLYVVMWVWVPLASVLLGPVWRMISPVRTLHGALTRLTGQRPDEGIVRLPERWGYWPAAIALASFVWLELVPPDRANVPVVGLALAVYAAVTLLGGLLFGAGWFASADPFEVYSTLAARLAPIGRRRDGRLVVRNPFNGLDATPIRPGLVPVVLVLLGSTAYDSLSNAPQWLQLTQRASFPVLVGTAGLAGCIALISILYAAATRAAGSVGGDRRQLPGLFAHSIVPIALGYIVAHYYSLAIIEGQRTLVLATSTADQSDNLLGLSTVDINYRLVQPALVASLQVTAVVAGHITGAVAAHDRAVRIFPGTRSTAAQTPLLLLMIAYTYVGLTLLFAA
ncbi:hypothetical protein OG799_16200 [Micromonospora sp. NBC_00898]|uniref:hypothetical protein n=1 Tax=Micromonospora sp. NBC_00898 TaxID=2975981 RepID=UPI00386F48A3|nr:hypothetical protein OG799_16200 [Micromonospora sp. NBC_00898]